MNETNDSHELFGDEYDPITKLPTKEQTIFYSKIQEMLALFSKANVVEAIEIGYFLLDHYEEEFSYFTANSQLILSISPYFNSNLQFSSKVLSFCAQLTSIYPSSTRSNVFFREDFISFIFHSLSELPDLIDKRNAISCLNNIYSKELFELIDLFTAPSIIFNIFISLESFFETFNALCEQQIQKSNSIKNESLYYSIETTGDLKPQFELVLGFMNFLSTFFDITPEHLFERELVEKASHFCFICLRSLCSEVLLSSLNAMRYASLNNSQFRSLLLKSKLMRYIINSLQINEKFAEEAIEILSNIIDPETPSIQIDLLREPILVDFIIFQLTDKSSLIENALYFISRLNFQKDYMPEVLLTHILPSLFNLLSKNLSFSIQKEIVYIFSYITDGLDEKCSPIYDAIIENSNFQNFINLFQIEDAEITYNLLGCINGLLDYLLNIKKDEKTARIIAEAVIEAVEDLEDPFLVEADSPNDLEAEQIEFQDFLDMLDLEMP